MISIVVVYNDDECLNKALLPSLRNQTAEYELITLNNTSMQFESAAEALNHGLKQATCRYVAFVHQDVVLPSYWIKRLLSQLSIVDKVNDNWGVVGVSGVTASGHQVGHIVDPYGHRCYLPLPREVQSLDEVCLIIRKESGLRFDEELGGFHFYGSDLCLQARVKGLPNFAVDACLEHLGKGKMDADFHRIAARLLEKWKGRYCPIRVIETTCGIFRLQTGTIAWMEYFFKRSRAAIRCGLRWPLGFLNSGKEKVPTLPIDTDYPDNYL
jgi:hypothetical protein